MTYDMYGAWDSVTGHNAPLHKGEGDENSIKDDLYTVDVALQFWLDHGWFYLYFYINYSTYFSFL